MSCSPWRNVSAKGAPPGAPPAMERYPILATFADGCASAASGAARRLRVSVTRHPTALYHMVVSFSLMPTFIFPAKPNAGAHLLPEAGATQERRLEAVRCSALFGGLTR